MFYARSIRIACSFFIIKFRTAISHLLGFCYAFNDWSRYLCFFFFQAEDGIRYWSVTGVQTCALPIGEPGTVDEGRQARAQDPVRQAFVRGTRSHRRDARARRTRRRSRPHCGPALARPEAVAGDRDAADAGTAAAAPRRAGRRA